MVTGKDPTQILIFPIFLWLWNPWIEWLTVPHEIVYTGIGMFVLESRSIGVRESEFRSRIKEVSFAKRLRKLALLDYDLEGVSKYNERQ